MFCTLIFLLPFEHSPILVGPVLIFSLIGFGGSKNTNRDRESDQMEHEASISCILHVDTSACIGK